MWHGTVPFDELKKRGCWKVEFFSGERIGVAASPFDLVPLNSLVTERRETIDPQATPEALVNYLGLEHIESLTGALVNFSPVRSKEIRSRSKVFLGGDVLYGRLRPYLNKVYVAAGEVSEGICSGEFYVLVPNQGRILPHVLRAILASEYVHPHVGKWQTGSALPRLQLHDLLEIVVPVPPIDVQKRYEEYLVAQMARYSELLREISELPQRAVSSLLAAMNAGSAEIGTTT